MWLSACAGAEDARRCNNAVLCLVAMAHFIMWHSEWKTSLLQNFVFTMHFLTVGMLDMETEIYPELNDVFYY